jgi:hypothetical protein
VCLLLITIIRECFVSLFVSYNSIHLPGPLCTKCISSFILNTPLFFWSCLAPPFTIPVKVGFLLAYEADSNVFLSCVLLLNIASLVIPPSADSSLFFLLYFFSLPRQGSLTFYKFSTLPPPTPFYRDLVFFITARLVRTITTTLCLFYTYKKN